MYFGYRTGEATAFVIPDTANNYGQWHGEAGERAGHRTLDASRGVAGAMIVATKVGARTTAVRSPLG